jgi:hypothetical protein
MPQRRHVSPASAFSAYIRTHFNRRRTALSMLHPNVKGCVCYPQDLLNYIDSVTVTAERYPISVVACARTYASRNVSYRSEVPHACSIEALE